MIIILWWVVGDITQNSPVHARMKKKKTITQSVKEEKKKKLHMSQLLFPFLLVSF